MTFKRFNVLVGLRVALLLITITILAVIFGDKRLFFNQIILFTVIIIQVVELLRYLNHTNRELARLFLAIRHSDFSSTFNEKSLGKSFDALQDSLTEIIKAYKDVKIEKEAQYHFLQMLVSQLHIGIISIVDDGEITIINPIARELTKVGAARQWKLLREINPKFAIQIEEMGESGRKLIEITDDNELKTFSVDVRTLIILDKPHKLITFQDINAEIEQKEIEAWHKLIRILTHEIMNSVTPIASLTETMQSVLVGPDGTLKHREELRPDTLEDIRFSLQTIHKRSEGLLEFVDNYRKLTKVPNPSLEHFEIKSMFLEIEKLMTSDLDSQRIIISTEVIPTDLRLHADPKLLEQVLINLVKNAIQAIPENTNGEIKLKAHQENHRVVIEVSDNGKGISEQELKEIFVPFFSTKKEGSGIGLSLSKQVMNLHGGTIKVTSALGSGSTFYLNFKAS
ncbi:MAG: ATP-binding protein [Cyclobacteriaceae bacterium]